ncbi:arsenate reductase family protein [uncultured Megasphaera sp.]|uniref:arsenate reductase family protein n=1 Tax=uncultured Megasphaera sp. TaxID=165188 RepID=UPI0025939BCD|nr:arsenate reductase family protein [uncultured Megasphaera sp.]
MNIQIFGTKKCFDTKKAIRYFKERGIKTQFIDLKEKGLSKGELTSIKQAIGGLDNLIDTNAKDKDTLALLQYIVPENKEEKLLENQHILKTPIVRNGKKATIGYAPDTWKTWE